MHSTNISVSEHDDDSGFGYSKTFRESSSKREQTSCIQFIIDTEESDLFSISTRDEVKQAVSDVCNVVLPQVLVAMQHHKSNQSDLSVSSDASKSTTSTISSYSFRSQSSARDLYREESIRHSLSDKKKHRIQTSDRKRQEKSCYEALATPMDVQQVRAQRSKLRSLIQTISEMKENSARLSSRDKSFPERLLADRSRRPRQEDTSEGSAPIHCPKLCKSDFPPLHNASDSQRTKNTDIASKCVVESSHQEGGEKRYKKKKKKKKEKTKSGSRKSSNKSHTEQHYFHDSHVSRPTNLLPIMESEGEESLLVSPNNSDGEARSRHHSKGCRTNTKQHKYTDRSKVSPPQRSAQETEATPEPPRVSEQRPEQCSVLEGERCSQDALHIVRSHKESAISLIKQGNGELNQARVDYTYDDIVKEMNRLAARLASCRDIPIGTEIKLNSDCGRNSFSIDDLSATGWTFSEQCDVSECTLHLSTEGFQGGGLDSAGTISREMATIAHRRDKSDSAQRISSTMHHSEIMNGVEPGEAEV